MELVLADEPVARSPGGGHPRHAVLPSNGPAAPLVSSRISAGGRGHERHDERADAARPPVDLRLGQIERVLALDVATTSLPTVYPTRQASAGLQDHRQLGLRHRPLRNRHGPGSARRDPSLEAGRCLEEELGTARRSHQVTRRKQRPPTPPRTRLLRLLVGHAGTPHLLHWDRAGGSGRPRARSPVRAAAATWSQRPPVPGREHRIQGHGRVEQGGRPDRATRPRGGRSRRPSGVGTAHATSCAKHTDRGGANGSLRNEHGPSLERPRAQPLVRRRTVVEGERLDVSP